MCASCSTRIPRPTLAEELEELELFDVDPATGKVKRPESNEPDANLAKTIKGSVSLIKAYQQCPAQAYGRITRQKQAKSIALVQGIAVHEAIEKYIKYDKDPIKEFMSALAFEAERNDIPLKGPQAEEARKVGPECVGAAVGILSHKGPSGVPLKERMDKDLIEKGFTVFRNGRKYVGKMDFLVFIGDEKYIIGDWKTGKNAPDKAELNNDIQFSMYAYAGLNDPNLKTYGLWPEYSVYMHLRGQSREIDANGRRVPKNRTKQPLQYDFPTQRTQEQVERQFVTQIEPAMSAMEAGHFGRWEGGKACSYCSFWDKSKERCTVEIPTDALLKKKDDVPQEALFGERVLTESKAATLKPYSDNEPAE